MGTVKIIIVDDHAAFRQMLRQHLAKEAQFEVTREFSDGDQLIAARPQRDCDIVLLDISMPGMYGLEALKRMKAFSSDTKIIIVSGRREKAYIEYAKQYGAAGYVFKDDVYDQLIPGIKKVLAGSTCFSEPEVSQ